MGGPYTDQEAAIVKQDWAAGLSAGKIAAKLPGRSRSSVIGFVHRHIGTQTRKTGGPPRQPPVYFAPSRHRPRSTTLLAPEPLPIIAESSTVGDRVKLIDRKAGQCAWPIGDPRSDDFGFCGCAVFRGIPGTEYGRSEYCLEHHRRYIHAARRPQFEKALARVGKSP